MAAPSITKKQIDHQIELLTSTTSFTEKKLPALFPAKILSVYDGDTFTFGMEDHGAYYSYHGRVDGIDCPEMKPGLNVPHRDLEKKFATKIRDVLRGKYEGKIVMLEFAKWEKFGRPLVRIFEYLSTATDGKGMNIGEWLVKQEYAVAYGGGTKESWADKLGKMAQADPKKLELLLSTN